MWPFRRRRRSTPQPTNGAARAAAESTAKKRAAERMTPAVEVYARHLAELPAEDFADRVARAFGRHA